MSVEDLKKLSPTDPELIDRIVSNIKARGIFDQFRKDCLADVDTKPAYQNLQQRVNGTVRGYLSTRKWNPSLNKNQLRENLRKYTVEQPYLEVGVDRVVDQVVNPKTFSVFMPKIEDIVYEMLGIEKPKSKQPLANHKNYTNNRITREPSPSKCSAETSVGPSVSPIALPSPAAQDAKPEPVEADENDSALAAGSVEESKSDMSYSPIAVKEEIKEEDVKDEEEKAEVAVKEEETRERSTPEAPEAINNEDDSNTIDEMPLLAASLDVDSNQASLSAMDSAPQICSTKSETSGQPEFAENRSLTPRPPADFDTLTNNLSSLKSDEKMSTSKKFDNFSNLDEKLKQADVNLRETSTKKPVDAEESSEPAKSSSDRSDSESTNSKIDQSESNTSVENTRFTRIKRRLLSDSSGDSNSESVSKAKPSDSEDGQSNAGQNGDKHPPTESLEADKQAKAAEGKKDKEKSSRSEGKSKEKSKSSHDRSNRHRTSHRSEKNDAHKDKPEAHDKKNDHSTKDSLKKHSEKSRRDEDKSKHSSSDSKRNEDSVRHDKEKQEKDKREKDKHDREKQDKEKNDREKNEKEKQDKEKNDREKQDREKHDREKNDREKHDREKQDKEKNDREKHRTSEKEIKADDKHRRDKTEHKSSSRKSSRDESKRKEDKSKGENHRDKDHRDKKADKKDSHADKNDRKAKDVDETRAKDFDEKKKSSKKKGGHCEDETKAKNSRRSSDRDSNGGAGSSSASKNSSSHNNSTNSSSKKSSKSDKGRSKHKGSSSKESVDDGSDGQSAGKEVDEVDLLLMQIKESIADEQEDACRKPKTASNFSEMKKIIEARKSCRLSTSSDPEDLTYEDITANLLHGEGDEPSEDSSADKCTEGSLEAMACDEGPATTLETSESHDPKREEVICASDRVPPKLLGPRRSRSCNDGRTKEVLDRADDLTSLTGPLKPCVVVNDVMSGPMGKKLKEFGFVLMGNQNVQSSLEGESTLTPGIKRSESDTVASDSLPGQSASSGGTKASENIEVESGCQGQEGKASPNDSDETPDEAVSSVEREKHAEDAPTEKHAENLDGNQAPSEAVPPETAEGTNQVPKTSESLTREESPSEASTSHGKPRETEETDQPSPALTRTRRKNAGSLMYAVLEGLNDKVVPKRASDAGGPAPKRKCTRSDKFEATVQKNDRSMSADGEMSDSNFDRGDVSNKENNQGHASNKIPRTDGLVNDVKIVETRLSRRKNQINPPAEVDKDVSTPRLRVSQAFKKTESKSQVVTEDAPKAEAKNCLSTSVTISARSAECLNEKLSSEPVSSSNATHVPQRRQSCPSLQVVESSRCTDPDKICIPEEAAEVAAAAGNSTGPVSESGKSSDLLSDEKIPQKSERQTRKSAAKAKGGTEKKWTVATRKTNRIVLTRSSAGKSPAVGRTGPKSAGKRSDSESSGDISCNSESSGQNDSQPNKSTDSGFVDVPATNPVVETPDEKPSCAQSQVPSTSNSPSDKENNVKICPPVLSCSEASATPKSLTVPSSNTEKTDTEETSSTYDASSSNAPSPKFTVRPEPSEFLCESDDEFRGFPSVVEGDEEVKRIFEKCLPARCKHSPKAAKATADAVKDEPEGKTLPTISPMRTRKKKCLVDRGENQANDIERRASGLKVTLVSRTITPGKNNGIVAKRSQTPVTNIKAPSNLRKRNSQTESLGNEKVKKTRNSQSYSATDLYKPRPLIKKETSVAVGSSPANKRLKKGPR